MTRYDKLLRMSRREIALRAIGALRIQGERARWRLRKPAWDRTRLKTVLAPDVLDPVLLTHIEARDWSAAQRLLVRALQAKPRRFILDPQLALELRHEILKRWPAASADASARADRVLAGHYDLLGYRGLSFDAGDGRIDWHFDPVHRRRTPRAFWADIPFLD